jgi:hypothetical protein
MKFRSHILMIAAIVPLVASVAACTEEDEGTADAAQPETGIVDDGGTDAATTDDGGASEDAYDATVEDCVPTGVGLECPDGCRPLIGEVLSRELECAYPDQRVLLACSVMSDASTQAVICAVNSTTGVYAWATRGVGAESLALAGWAYCPEGDSEWFVSAYDRECADSSGE